eukprot:UN33367
MKLPVVYIIWLVTQTTKRAVSIVPNSYVPHIISRKFFKLFCTTKDLKCLLVDFRKACVAINKETTLHEIEELFHFITTKSKQETFDQAEFEHFCDIVWANWMDQWKEDMFSYVTDVCDRLVMVENTPVNTNVISKQLHSNNTNTETDNNPENETIAVRYFHIFGTSDNRDVGRIEFHKSCIASNRNILPTHIEELFDFIGQGKPNFDEDDLLKFLNIKWNNWMDSWKE